MKPDQSNQNLCPAKILLGAVDVISRLRDKTMVISLNTAIMHDAANLNRALIDIHFIATVGVRPVVVHGGGPLFWEALKSAGFIARDDSRLFEDVLRVPQTTELYLNVCRRSLAGETSEFLAREFEQFSGRAMTLNFESTMVLSGKRGAEPLEVNGGAAPENDPRGIHATVQGHVTKVDRLVIDNLCYAQQVPFIPAMCACPPDDGACLVDADAAASKVASELTAARLIMYGEGIDSMISGTVKPHRLTCADATRMIEGGQLGEKNMDVFAAACRAVRSGVDSSFIVAPNQPHSMLLNVFTDSGDGVEIAGVA